MRSEPEIWLPTSEMKVMVEDGKVRIWETMTMERGKVKRPAGFTDEKKEGDDRAVAPRI